MAEKKKEYMSPKTTSFFTSDLEWLEEAYPNCTLTFISSMLLRNFRRVHDDTGVTPNKCAKDAGKELKESIEEGILGGN